ncbi:leukemia inhibitory factor receptor-like [Centropristis striata]|uniref:leukemia inhibitory factor receptor-like n=1 Tax=Centropristis striata TaxID=184440 RepID=UPI0027E1A989|nr:leukemia inhibitory factor receptor-like [Centropristis striata]
MVTVKGIVMVTWLLLASLLCMSTQDGNGQDNGVLHCGPQNLTLSSFGETILVTWEDEPSCSAVQDVLMYDVVVRIADKKAHKDKVAVAPDQIGSTHSWNWTSLALDCGSHSVRLRSRYKNHTSPWKTEPTNTVKETKRPEVYPKDKDFKIGSRATFCCVLPEGQDFKKMYLYEYGSPDINATKITNEIYALTAHLNQAKRFTDMRCETTTEKNGASALVGYPPEYSDLQCETQDLKSVDCYWTVVRERSETQSSRKPTEHKLLGSTCDYHLSENKCSQEVKIDVGEKNWTLTAENSFGTVELSDTADLTKRVHMFPPVEVTASIVNTRNVSLRWRWTVQQYYNLNITCQVNIGENTISETGVGLHFSAVNDLIPNWTYNVIIRCGTVPHFWKWSDWSKSFKFITKGDVPDALDVWMQRKDNQIMIIWKKPLANQSHGDIEDYEVTWTKTTERDQPNRTTVAFNNDRLALSLDTTEEYIITVTARNINGSSSPSALKIPSFSSDEVDSSHIIGSDGSFNLSWAASPTASGYIVDWCPTLRCDIVEWLKVPPSETNARIFSNNFKDGQRYSLSVSALTQGAPVLLERREGYVSEQCTPKGLFKSLKGEQQDSDYVVSWDPIPLREQTAFIQGYVLYCKNTNTSKVTHSSTGDPKATSLTAGDLKISHYTFTVKAQTAVGECSDSFITATLTTPTDNLIKAVFISLGTVFGLLSLMTVLCYINWACIKQTIYPPIPKPILTSLDEHRCRLPYVVESHHIEADITVVPEVHCPAEAPLDGYVTSENMPFIFSQTPDGYYNQPLVKDTPSVLSVPATAVPSGPGIPSSPFRSVFPNPSYNLSMQPGDQLSILRLQLQKESSIERSSSGYQPQGHAEPFTLEETQGDPDSPMSCDSSYMLLPQSPTR